MITKTVDGIRYFKTHAKALCPDCVRRGKQIRFDNSLHIEVGEGCPECKHRGYILIRKWVAFPGQEGTE